MFAIRAFFTRSPSSGAESIYRFYDRYKRTKEIVATHLLHAVQDPEKAQAYYEEHKDEIDTIKDFERQAEGLSDGFRHLLAIRAAGDMTPQRKKEEMDRATTRMISSARDFLSGMYDVSRPYEVAGFRFGTEERFRQRPLTRAEQMKFNHEVTAEKFNFIHDLMIAHGYRELSQRERDETKALADNLFRPLSVRLTEADASDPQAVAEALEEARAEMDALKASRPGAIRGILGAAQIVSRMRRARDFDEFSQALSDFTDAVGDFPDSIVEVTALSPRNLDDLLRRNKALHETFMTEIRKIITDNTKEEIENMALIRENETLLSASSAGARR
jgi:hypothetical protein